MLIIKSYGILNFKNSSDISANTGATTKPKIETAIAIVALAITLALEAERAYRLLINTPLTFVFVMFTSLFHYINNV